MPVSSITAGERAEHGYPMCDAVVTWGVVPASDPRYFGGHVDAQGIRHNPCRHADDCPKAQDIA